MRSTNNFVAKHINEFNKPATHVDRKKEAKKGKNKHKKPLAKLNDQE